MARFILTFNKQVIKEYPFLKDSITIGRKEDNTIVIDNLAVGFVGYQVDGVPPFLAAATEQFTEPAQGGFVIDLPRRIVGIVDEQGLGFGADCRFNR